MNYYVRRDGIPAAIVSLLREIMTALGDPKGVPRSLRHRGHVMRRALPLVLLVSACSSSQKIVGGGCSYEQFHGTCRFEAFERGAPGQAWAFYVLDGGFTRVPVEFRIDDDRAAAFEAYLRVQPALPCGGERIVTGACAPVVGSVEIPSFDGATKRR